MSALDAIEIVDAIPGRLRLKVHTIKRNPILARLVERDLGAVAGIERVEAKALTGSVVVNFDAHRLNTAEGMSQLGAALRELLREVSEEELAPWLERLRGWLAGQ